jgi:hypothetical protein
MYHKEEQKNLIKSLLLLQCVHFMQKGEMFKTVLEQNRNKRRQHSVLPHKSHCSLAMAFFIYASKIIPIGICCSALFLALHPPFPIDHKGPLSTLRKENKGSAL